MNKQRYEEIARLKNQFSSVEKFNGDYTRMAHEIQDEHHKLAISDENFKKLKAISDEKTQEIISKYDKDGKLIKDPFYDNLREYLRKNHSKQVNWDPYNPNNSKPVDGNQEEKPYMYVQEGEITIPIYLDEIGNKILNEVRASKEYIECGKEKRKLREMAEKKVMGMSQNEYDEVWYAKDEYERLSFLGKAIVKMKEKKLSAKQVNQDNSMKL